MSRFPLTSDIDVKYNAPMLQPGAEVPPSRQALANLEREFQTCLVKLKYSNISLGKIPEDSTFGLAIELNDDQAAPNNVNVIPVSKYQRITLLTFNIVYGYLDAL